MLALKFNFQIAYTIIFVYLWYFTLEMHLCRKAFKINSMHIFLRDISLKIFIDLVLFKYLEFIYRSQLNKYSLSYSYWIKIVIWIKNQ